MRIRKLIVVIAPIAIAICAQAHAQSMTPPKAYSMSPTGVNMLDGSYVYDHVDLSIGPLKLERNHLGGPETSKAYFGPTWTHNWDIRYIVKLAGTINVNTTVVIGRTKYHYLGQPSTGTAPDPDAIGTTMAGNTFTDRDGTKYIFDTSAARVTEIDSPDGSTVKISYVGNVPRTIVSNRGYAIVLVSDGSGRVTSACGYNLTQTVVTTSTTCAAAALKTSYTYSTNLTGFTDVMGNFTTISYAPKSVVAVTCISDAGSTNCPITNVYDAGPTSQRIAEQDTSDGKTWLFTTTGQYASRNDSDPDQQAYSATMTAPDGGVTRFGFNGVGLIGITDPDSNTTRFGTVQPWMATPAGATLPEGNKVQFAYNARLVDAGSIWSAKPGSGLANISQGTKTFPSNCANPVTCNLALTVTDARGNVTTYTYDPQHGGVLTATMPADSNGIQAVIRNSYIQRYAWISNGAGYIQATSPIWLLSESRTCRSSSTVANACSAGTADEIVTTYDYGPDSGPNSLLLRGIVVTADGISRRICYGYDWQGNQISQTSPRAALASCP